MVRKEIRGLVSLVSPSACATREENCRSVRIHKEQVSRLSRGRRFEDCGDGNDAAPLRMLLYPCVVQSTALYYDMENREPFVRLSWPVGGEVVSGIMKPSMPP